MEPTFEFGFDNPKHSDHVLVLKSDSTIHQRVHVNNLLLSANSKYFLTLFTNDMKESSLKEIEIQLSKYHSILFYLIIKSLYTGVLTVPNLSEVEFKLEIEQSNFDNGEGTISGSEESSIGDSEQGHKKGKKRALEGLKNSEQTEDVNNNSVAMFESKESKVCFDILALLDRFLIETRFANCITLLKKAVCNSVQTACYQISVLEESFQHISGVEVYKKTLIDFVAKKYIDLDNALKETDFLYLPISIIQSILQNDSLLVSCEETVLQALRKWVNHNPIKRVPLVPTLLHFIKFAQMDLTYLLDYVVGCDCFFDHSCCDIDKGFETFCLLQNYASRAVRYLSFNLLSEGEKFSLAGIQYKNWMKKRAGYSDSETSTVVEWECDLEKTAYSSPFFLRGVWYTFALVFQETEHFFCIKPDRILTSGENDQRYTICQLAFTLKAFNFQSNIFDILKKDQFLIGVNAGCVVDEDLKLLSPLSPYINKNASNSDSSSSSNLKRMVRLSAFLRLGIVG